MDNAPGAIDPGRGLATLGILLATIATWVSLPISLWQARADLSLALTQENVVFLVAGTSLLATVTLAAGAVGLGRPGLLLVSLVVTSLHLGLQVALGVAQLMLGAQRALTLGRGAAVLTLGVALVGLVLGRIAARSPRPTALRWVALGVIVLSAALLVLHDGSLILPYIDLADAIPLILFSFLSSVAVVAATGFLGLPRERVRYVAAGLFGLLVVWYMVGVPWGYSVDRYYVEYLAGAVMQEVLYVVAAVLAVLAGLRLPGRRPAPPAGARP